MSTKAGVKSDRSSKLDDAKSSKTGGSKTPKVKGGGKRGSKSDKSWNMSKTPKSFRQLKSAKGSKTPPKSAKTVNSIKFGKSANAGVKSEKSSESDASKA